MPEELKPAVTVSELRELKKHDLASSYEDIAWVGLHIMRETGLMEKRNLAAVSAATGTAIDKMRLLKGESTVITETRLANHRWAEEELQKLMRELGLSREEAMKLINERAPTWAAMLM